MSDDARHPNDPPSPATVFPNAAPIEVIQGFQPRSRPAYVLFDFDGTLSLIREGWIDVMVPMMVEHLQAVAPDEPADVLQRVCAEFVMELTGKQTIYQMIRLADEIESRGGTAEDPLVYKNEYHGRLMARIDGRREALSNGSARPEDLLVPGSREILDLLTERGVELYLASGTDDRYVQEEVDLLGLRGYFGERVRGAVDDYRSFSKAQVIEGILAENRLEGTSLLGFGDGYVEITNVREVGGTAVAVASDEANRSGKPDDWKRTRLLAAGAQIVIPDFGCASELIEWLWSS